MQRTRRTSLNPSESSHSSGDAQEQSEPAGLEPAGSASSADGTSAGTPALAATTEDLSAPDGPAGSSGAAGVSPSPGPDPSSSGGGATGETGVPATPEDVDSLEAAAGPVKHRSHPRLIGLFAVVGVLVLGLDQLTKALALQHLTPGDPVNVIGELLKFNLIRNPGAAFSLGSDFTPVISTIQIVVALGVIWLSRRLGSAGWAVAFGLLFGGAVGNITDRIFREPSPFHGHVVDFLQTPHWAIFNVADMAVTSAAILLVIQTLRGIKLDGTKDVSAK
ncbi:signal peptidase II [Kribbella sp. CA-253562]|uniref:signal peptidase II n=1 Tax=Kribbella sp. CA-253562 TaxID=3239942 RepID=UPI003D907D85